MGEKEGRGRERSERVGGGERGRTENGRERGGERAGRVGKREEEREGCQRTHIYIPVDSFPIQGRIKDYCFQDMRSKVSARVFLLSYNY